MRRTIVIIIFLLLAVVGLIAMFYVWVIRHDNANYSPIDAIPTNATMVLSIESFETFASSLKTSQWWKSVEQNDVFKGFAELVSFVDSAANSEKGVKEVLGEAKIVASFYNHYPQGREFLFSIEIGKGRNTREVLELVRLQSLGLAKSNDISVAGNSGVIVEVPDKNNSTFIFTVSGNLLLVSNSPELLVESIELLKKGGGIKTDESFQEVFQTAASGVAANVFVNTNELSKVVSHELNVNILKGIARWVGLDVQVSPDLIVANGLVVTSKEYSEFYKIFNRQNPVQFTLRNFMPISTSFFVWYGIPSTANFLADNSDYIDYIGLTEPYNKNLSAFLSRTGISIDEFLAKNLDNELAAIAVNNETDSTEWYMLVKTRSGSATLQSIENLARKSNLAMYEYSPEKQRAFLIIENPIKSYLSTLLGNSFLRVKDAYVTAIENVLVFGSSVNSIKYFIDEFLRNNTLSANGTFKGIQQRLSTSSNLIIYGKGTNSEPLNGLYLQGVPFKINRPGASTNHSFTWQVVGGSPKLFAMLVLKSPNEAVGVNSNPFKNAKWICMLGAEPMGIPHSVINHLTGQAEVLVQDSNNGIYLISNQGHILWNRKIDAPILGNVTQVDVFRNRKLQMAFVAGNRVYLIDRTGNDVEGFPVNLPAKATSPLSVFDYDKNRYYRFLVACDDKTIYCYDSNGKPVNGWFNFKTETVVSKRIGFVSYQGKDYIVVFDQNRQYLLNRRGEERVKPQSFFAIAKNADYYLAPGSGNSPFIVTTDSLGVIKKVFFDGKVESVVLEPFSARHTFRFSGKHYFILDQNRISIYANDRTLKNIILPPRGTFDDGALSILSDGKYILASQNGNILGFDLTGKQVNPFPFHGTLPLAKINERDQAYVTLSKQNGVICFAIK